MDITMIYPENATNKIKYDMTMSPKAQKLSDCKGQRLDLAAYCIYLDERTDKQGMPTGEAQEILSVMTLEGEIYATNSATCIRELNKMIELFGKDGITAVEILPGTSKAGREFITLAYAGE